MCFACEKDMNLEDDEITIHHDLSYISESQDSTKSDLI